MYLYLWQQKCSERTGVVWKRERGRDADCTAICSTGYCIYTVYAHTRTLLSGSESCEWIYVLCVRVCEWLQRARGTDMAKYVYVRHLRCVMYTFHGQISYYTIISTVVSCALVCGCVRTFGVVHFCSRPAFSLPAAAAFVVVIFATSSQSPF